jgi:hypothetical protein
VHNNFPGIRGGAMSTESSWVAIYYASSAANRSLISNFLVTEPKPGQNEKKEHTRQGLVCYLSPIPK